MRAAIIGTVSLLVLSACQAEQAAPPQPKTTPVNNGSASEIPLVETKIALFGDLHVHTTNSFDAFIFGTRTDANDAYRFAKGEPIDNGAGDKIKLDGPPLDFYAVTDHGEYLGVVPAMRDRSTDISKTDTAKSIFGLTATDRRGSFLRVGQTIVSGDEIEEIYDRELMDSVWARNVAAAEAHNEPGTFTTFAGYEFTAMRIVSDTAAANLHRNVIFKDSAPSRLFTTLDSPRPDRLWGWMDEQRSAGHDVLAIPHNSNASNGMMFSFGSYNGSPMDRAEAELRLRNEPVVEITQVKGTSETHPLLSPNDEWSNFEIYDNLIGGQLPSYVTDGSFVRQGLARGFTLEKGLGVNPFQFGVIGSSDTHISAGAYGEESFFGKFSHDMNSESRQTVPPKGAKTWPENFTPETDLIATPQYGASGLAGVWARANTRAEIFDAMAKKETFGTSGPRIKVRFFAMQDRVGKDILDAPDMVSQAYAAGVPMGSRWEAGRKAPQFLAWASRDANSAPLERMQVIKSWMKDGRPQERIYDIACADGRSPVDGRCPDQRLEVDLTTCSLRGEGAAELKTLWVDPDFDAKTPTAYYVRVLEAPKCRWSTWDAVRNGTAPNPDMLSSVQDRAWSSAVWVQ
ncbi:MAG: DUF3604 domain-containing protein [Litorimonas sp.]